MKKCVVHIISLLFPVVFPAMLNGASPKHNELWNRIFISHTISEKWRIEGEYQYRWQNTPGSNGWPSYRLQQGLRVWTYYQFKPAWTLGVSPICWFRAYPLIIDASDFSKPATTEFRVATSCEWKRKLFSAELKARVGYESRFSNKDGEDDWTRKDRARGRVMITQSLACIDSSLSAVSIYAGDEYFFQGQEFFASGTAFDQNRIMGGVAWKICKWCKVDATYLHILRNSTASDYFERVVWLNTTFYL